MLVDVNKPFLSYFQEEEEKKRARAMAAIYIYCYTHEEGGNLPINIRGSKKIESGRRILSLRRAFLRESSARKERLVSLSLCHSITDGILSAFGLEGKQHKLLYARSYFFYTFLKRERERAEEKW